MNEQSKKNWSSGRLVPAVAPSNPPVEVDCSHWDADIPAAKWSTGRLVPAVAPSNPPVEVDCSHWDADVPATACLEITVRLTPDADPGRVMLFAPRIIQSVQNAFPQLELKYDPRHSRVEAGTVVIGLASSNGRTAEEKLEALAQVIHAATAEFPMATVSDIRLARAA